MIGSSKSVWGFDPRSVPGCQLWLDAADTTTISPSAGGTLTSWTDKSGTSKTITINSAPSYSTTGFNGNYPSMTFTSGNNLTLTIPSVGTGDIAVFVVWRQTTSENPQQNVFSIGTPGGGSETALGWNNGEGRYKFYRFSGSQSVNTATTNNVNVIGSALQVSGLRTLHINGVAPSGTGTESYNQTNTTAFIGGGTFPLVGQLAEVIFYIGTVTTAQQQQIEGYLAHKWGLTGYYDSSTPLTIPGCQFWLDAADQNAMTLSGSSVVTVLDKSGNGKTLTGGTGWSYNVTKFNGSYPSFYRATTGSMLGQNTTFSLTSTNITLFFVGMLESSGSTTSQVYFIDGGGVNTGRFYNYVDYTGGVDYVNIMHGDIQTTASYPITNRRIVSPFIFSQSTGTSPQTGSINGIVFDASGGNTGSMTVTGLTIGGPWNNVSGALPYTWPGHICEVLVYNSALTTSERQTIEGYLSRKWGIGSSSIPSTHPFYSIRPHLRAFQPIDVPGCQLWFDAADQSSLTLSGTTVTAWINKSDNSSASTGSGTVSVNQATLKGISSVRFPAGTNYLNVASQTYTTSYRNLFFVVTVGASGSKYFYLSAASGNTISGQCYSWDNGDIELNKFGTNGLVTNNPINFFSSTSVVSICTSSGGNTGIWVNGVSQSLFENNVGTGGFWSTGTTSTTITLGGQSGITTGILDMYEFLQYDGDLTTSQRQQVEGYLAHKWGLSPTYATNTPLSIPGCQLWLDAADSSTITGTTSITAWRDKSGRGNNAVFTGTNPSYVAASNVVITANLNQGFTVPAATIQQTTGSGSIFLVYGDQQTQGSSYAALFSSPLPAQSFCQSLKRPDSYSYQFNNSTSPVLATVVNALNTTNTIIYTMNYTYNSTTGSIRVNGTTCASSFNSSPTPSGALTISSSGWGDGANVRLYEIITFVNVVPLTTVQQQQIEGYLAKKWGLTVSGQFLSTHPFKSFPPASLPFSPRNISGLQLWLDGADQSSMTLSGSSVTVWNDKSGNGKNATAGGTTPTYSSATRSIVFGGAGYFTNSSLSLPLSTRSVFIVCTQTSRAGDFEGIVILVNPLGSDVDYASPNAIPYSASGSNPLQTGAFTLYGNNGTYIQNYGSYTTTPLGIYVDVFGSSSGTLYVNGTSNSTDADSSTLGTANGYILGARKAGSSTTLGIFFNGTISEVIIYNTAVTTSQRQQIEGYLAQKWGLTGSLPSSHPFKKLPA